MPSNTTGLTYSYFPPNVTCNLQRANQNVKIKEINIEVGGSLEGRNTIVCYDDKRGKNSGKNPKV